MCFAAQACTSAAVGARNTGAGRTPVQQAGRIAKLAQQRNRIHATELEIDDEPAAPPMAQPGLHNILQHVMRLLDQVAEQPVERIAGSRPESKRVLASMLDLR